MLIYKVSLTCRQGGESTGFRFFRYLREAKQHARANISHTESEIEPINISRTREGVIAALNAHASHPDNG